jgi:hypothetical protein
VDGADVELPAALEERGDLVEEQAGMAAIYGELLRPDAAATICERRSPTEMERALYDAVGVLSVRRCLSVVPAEASLPEEKGLFPARRTGWSLD